MTDIQAIVLGTFVEMLRSRAKMSQSELARTVSVSQSGLSRIEKGTISVTFHTAHLLERVLGMKTGELSQHVACIIEETKKIIAATGYEPTEISPVALRGLVQFTVHMYDQS